MAENRVNRLLEGRDQESRVKSWRPPELLPSPIPEEGYSYHWVRIATNGKPDASNISAKLREGWEPVLASTHPEVQVNGVENERYADNIVIGGLMLCKTPKEFVSDRNAYYRNQSKEQIRSVDNNFMRENDPRMPLFSERRTKVTFGSGDN